MAKLIILGSSNAIATENHQNAYMVLVGETRTVLVDSPQNPISRLKRVGVNYNNITDLVVTHFHPDHVSGIPILLMDMWLRGRTNPLKIYGLEHALSRLKNLMDGFTWDNWPQFFPVTFKTIPSKTYVPLLGSDEFDILTTEVRHMIPTLGLRIELKPSRKVLAYSCDTEPCQEVVGLAAGADILIHEAAGEFVGHTSSKQAAEIATKAGVEELYLIHYPTGEFWEDSLLDDARENFAGEVKLAEDLMEIEF